LRNDCRRRAFRALRRLRQEQGEGPTCHEFDCLFRTEAELAKARIEPSGPVVVETSCSSVSLCVTDDFKGFEPLWEELQRTVRCTATQT
jgi:hypothetical protein